jgi:hypothetical protein
MATVTSRYPVAKDGRALARRTAGGVLVAVVVALVVRTLAGAVGVPLGAGGPTSPFGTLPIVLSTVVSGTGAALAYAALVRLTERPVRNFTVLAAVVFAGMLVPVIFVAPAMGLTLFGQATLVVLHAVVAVPLVAFVIGAVRL